jgi:hypothetical protein
MTISAAPQTDPPDALRKMSATTSLLPGAAMYVRPLAMRATPCRTARKSRSEQIAGSSCGTLHVSMCAASNLFPAVAMYWTSHADLKQPARKVPRSCDWKVSFGSSADECVHINCRIQFHWCRNSAVTACPTTAVR